jgi:hypothetical protein
VIPSHSLAWLLLAPVELLTVACKTGFTSSAHFSIAKAPFLIHYDFRGAIIDQILLGSPPIMKSVIVRELHCALRIT